MYLWTPLPPQAGRNNLAELLVYQLHLEMQMLAITTAAVADAADSNNNKS